MARLSEYLNKSLLELEDDSIYHDLILKDCVISGAIKPLKGGFHQRASSLYVISSNAVLYKYGLQGFCDFGITTGEAMLDANMTTKEIDIAKKTILANIEYGINYAVNHTDENRL